VSNAVAVGTCLVIGAALFVGCLWAADQWPAVLSF
jgi:hypothetical protein